MNEDSGEITNDQGRDDEHTTTRCRLGTDFDHLDPRWAENPYPIWDDLRIVLGRLSIGE
jgi:hypothetical protein